MFRRSSNPEYPAESPVVSGVRGLVQERVSVLEGSRRKGLRSLFNTPIFTVETEVLIPWMKTLPGLEHNPELSGCPSDYVAQISLYSGRKGDEVRLTVFEQGNKWASLLQYRLALPYGKGPIFSYRTEEEDMAGVIPARKSRGVGDESHLRGIVPLLESVAVRK